MSGNLNQVRQRTYRYFYEDGLAEMALGGLFVLMGLALLALQRSVVGSAQGWIGAVTILVLVFGGILAVRWGVATLKERVTYPRGGYVSYRKETSPTRRWLPVVLVGGLLALAIALPARYTGLIGGGILAVLLFYVGYRVSLLRLQVAALVPLALGLAATFTQVDETLSTVVVLAPTGVVLLLLGGSAFFRFLRSTKQEEEG